MCSSCCITSLCNIRLFLSCRIILGLQICGRIIHTIYNLLRDLYYKVFLSKEESILFSEAGAINLRSCDPFRLSIVYNGLSQILPFITFSEVLLFLLFLISPLKREEQQKEREGAMNIVSELQIWEQIDVAERYSTTGKHEEAASLASAIIQKIQNSNFETPVDDMDLSDMMNSAGMLIVQSYEQLGRIRQVFVELEKLYGSIWAVPAEVFLTGANLQVKDGFKLELREILEEYLSKWEYMIDAGVYALREDKTNKLSSNTLENDHKRRYFLSCEFYLEVAAIYTVKLLARSFHNIELAISWVDSADLPQDGREVRPFLVFPHLRSINRNRAFVCNASGCTGSCSWLKIITKALLKKLQKLAKKQRRAAARVSTASSNEDSVETENEQSMASKGDKERKDFSRKLVQQSIQRGSDRLDTFLWWFRSIKIKIGGLQFVIPSGKLMLFFSLFFWMSFLLRKRGDVFRSLAKSKINSLKQAAFDALRLAFSVQMNPLAAVQQVPALPRASW
ncbi:hypothetical protein LUZ63_006721 [Rhynchospora breviuscula]|uniref:Uncharacterized protein n=1 Tax=Rhynchospora breviuscula TaxID=2022672 RepID=A0A9Q0CRI7_9POAL|nr:hypothetical protein LUZ63_006721 [Rhynchospora breviuscula]